MGAPAKAEWNGLIQTFSICNLVLFLLYYFAVFSSVDHSKRPPEDVVVGQYKNPDDAVIEVNNAEAKRYERHLNNVTENLPVNMALFLVAFIIQNLCNMSGEGKANTMCLTIVIVTYTGFRVLYSICYLQKLQPWRSIMYLLALGSTLVAIINMIIAAFSTDISNTFATG
jgi:uncharacterized MAPEG superfamily protein